MFPQGGNKRPATSVRPSIPNATEFLNGPSSKSGAEDLPSLPYLCHTFGPAELENNTQAGKEFHSGANQGWLSPSRSLCGGTDRGFSCSSGKNRCNVYPMCWIARKNEQPIIQRCSGGRAERLRFSQERPSLTSLNGITPACPRLFKAKCAQKMTSPFPDSIVDIIFP